MPEFLSQHIYSTILHLDITVKRVSKGMKTTNIFTIFPGDASETPRPPPQVCPHNEKHFPTPMLCPLHVLVYTC